MSREEWKSAIAKLKPGLSYIQAAEKLGEDYAITRKWMLRCKYETRDGRGDSTSRRNVMLAEYANVDWTKSNVMIALQFGKTRERIRQVRDMLGHEKVEARGRKAS